MRPHTLIPEAYSYGIAILILYSLGSFSLAAQIHARWLGPKRVGLMVIYCAVMAFAVIWGLLIFDPGQIFGGSTTVWIVSIPIGLVAGLLAVWSDQAIVRRLSRRVPLLRTPRLNSEDARLDAARVEANLRYLGDVPETRLTSGKSVGSPRLQSPESRRFGLLSVVLAAVLEEIVYRGLLVQVCLLIPNGMWAGLGLAATVVFFSLSHLPFGWPQVAAKSPLGLLALSAALGVGSVLPAIATHLVFNIKIWRNVAEAPALEVGAESRRRGMGVQPRGW
jgi:CAAX prenyl protease-like protein